MKPETIEYTVTIEVADERCDFCDKRATRKKGPVLLNPPPHEARLHAPCARKLDEGEIL